MKDNSVWDGNPKTAWFTILETYNTYYLMKTEFLNDMQRQLLEFVKEQHGEQLRKYINTPYWEHPLAVAKMFEKHSYFGEIEIALCHDLFEDTPCSFDQLYNKLIEIGYGRDFSYDICTHVKELTDEFTKEKYPYLNRFKRKEAESRRLGKISEVAQTVKYADLIHNTSSIVEHDPEFAKKYLVEKRDILNYMRNGHIDFFIECCWTLKNAMAKLDVTSS